MPSTILGEHALTLPTGTTAQRPGTPVKGMMRLNTSNSDIVEVYNGTVWQAVGETGIPLTVDYIVIAGGGGGGGDPHGAGGGAGGYREFTNQVLGLSTLYTVTIGAGGSGVSAQVVAPSGSNSVFSTITSAGGGGGATFGAGGGASGGSGGGAAYSPNTIGAGNTPGTSPSQGNNGGYAYSGEPNYGSGGGGGASAVGVDGISTKGGNGGAGTSSSITGTAVTRAGGGGGSSYNGGSGGPIGGTGGAGGGGDGTNGISGTGVSGTANTGGGGGGGERPARTGGNGGTGVVIIRYPDYRSIGGGTGLTFTTASAGGYKVTTFTAGTGTISFT